MVKRGAKKLTCEIPADTDGKACRRLATWDTFSVQPWGGEYHVYLCGHHHAILSEIIDDKGRPIYEHEVSMPEGKDE